MLLFNRSHFHDFLFLEIWMWIIWLGFVNVWPSIRSETIFRWTSQIGAKSVFLNISRDIVKNTPMAPLCEVHLSAYLILSSLILEKGKTLLQFNFIVSAQLCFEKFSTHFRHLVNIWLIFLLQNEFNQSIDWKH